MIDIRPLYEAEKNKGKPSGPVFVNGWPSDRDPRFCEPINPLYDPLACRDTDWRCRLDIVSYLRFSDHVAHDKGMLYRYVIESAEDEDIFNVSCLVNICSTTQLPCIASPCPSICVFHHCVYTRHFALHLIQHQSSVISRGRFRILVWEGH